MALLDCRDTQISLWQAEGAVHSPGFVLHDSGDYHFGRPALEQSRLRPRDTNSRFWWQLSTQPLKPALGAARHTADLVHSHLRAVHSEAGAPDTLTFAVPDSMPREQLSLLLGVAQACDFRVAGLVSRSVLLASLVLARRGASGRALHVESQLNQSTVNELEIDGDSLRLLRSTPLPACGLLALQERCVGAIASAFVQQTRFDPRRSASSEQTLYNRLPEILSSVRERGEASVDIDGHRCRITASALEPASQRLIDGVRQAVGGGSASILLDPELSLLPGVDELGGEHLAATALWDAWQTQESQVELGDDDVHLIDRLKLGSAIAAGSAPRAEPEDSPRPAPSDAPASLQPVTRTGTRGATHVLLDTRALPLRGSQVVLGKGFELREDGGQWTLHGKGALINGLPATPGHPLALGDTLSLGAAGAGRLIEVVD
ncbi:MAG: hypothetical protein V2I82_01975 [Halieaceae bacterium]|jgi:hypothetical protein|nr:hypothetical protein [Halieaceae bacterium]